MPVARRTISDFSVATLAAQNDCGQTHPLQSESFVYGRTHAQIEVVGGILASWRYDISGISPEMRKDYEQHFAECAHCSGRQEVPPQPGCDAGCFDFSGGFLLSLRTGGSQHIRPVEHMAFNVFGLDVADTYHMLVSAGIAGLVFSLIALALVLTATRRHPYLSGIRRRALAKLIEERCPRESSVAFAVKTSSALQTPGPPHAGGFLCAWGCEGSYHPLSARLEAGVRRNL